MSDRYIVESDGVTVWVNGERGLIGRFGKNGIDIHRASEEQGRGVCLHCTHEATTVSDWDVFVSKMKEFYGVEISETHKPKRFQ